MSSDVHALPLVPKNSLSYRQLLEVVRVFKHRRRSAQRGWCPVTRIALGPRWLVPPLVLVTSPNGIGDLLARNHALGERCIVHDEVRHLAGVTASSSCPTSDGCRVKRALQPVFTNHNVRRFGGQHVRAAQALVDDWRGVGTLDGGLDVDSTPRVAV